MKRRPRTISGSITATIGLTASQLLGYNRLRKAFIMGPLVGSGSIGTGFGVTVLTGSSLGAIWDVPAGVTQILDMYCWAAGGSAGAAGASLGGGGGGGGGFVTTGPLTVVPGQPFQLTYGPGGSGTSTIVKNQSNTIIAQAGPGATARRPRAARQAGPRPAASRRSAALELLRQPLQAAAVAALAALTRLVALGQARLAALAAALRRWGLTGRVERAETAGSPTPTARTALSSGEALAAVDRPPAAPDRPREGPS